MHINLRLIILTTDAIIRHHHYLHHEIIEKCLKFNLDNNLASLMLEYLTLIDKHINYNSLMREYSPLE